MSLLMEKRSRSLKLVIKMSVSTQFCLGNISNIFGATQSRKLSLNVYDF